MCIEPHQSHDGDQVEVVVCIYALHDAHTNVANGAERCMGILVAGGHEDYGKSIALLGGASFGPLADVEAPCKCGVGAAVVVDNGAVVPNFASCRVCRCAIQPNKRVSGASAQT